MRKDFFNRFKLKTTSDIEKSKFIVSITNYLKADTHFYPLKRNSNVCFHIAKELGIEYPHTYDNPTYANYERLFFYLPQNDFHDFLLSLETIYEFYNEFDKDGVKKWLEHVVNTTLSNTAIDLEIEFKDGKFIPRGAKLLDKGLVDDLLDWLSDPKYKTVFDPFKKGLSHFIGAKKEPERLHDVITDMYESLEAFAKIVNKNDKDLSANRERLISSLRLDKYYSNMLKDYIEYANEEFRHAQSPTKKKLKIDEEGAEAFMYLTGLFLRLGIKKLS